MITEDRSCTNTTIVAAVDAVPMYSPFDEDQLIVADSVLHYLVAGAKHRGIERLLSLHIGHRHEESGYKYGKRWLMVRQSRLV